MVGKTAAIVSLGMAGTLEQQLWATRDASSSQAPLDVHSDRSISNSGAQPDTSRTSESRGEPEVEVEEGVGPFLLRF